MSDDELYPPPLDRLKELDHPSMAWSWAEGKQDYVAELGLTAEHVPGLIRIARQWLAWYREEEDAPDEPPRPHHEEHFRVDAPAPTDKQERIRQGKHKQKLKAEQKQRQKARKRNRKAK